MASGASGASGSRRTAGGVRADLAGRVDQAQMRRANMGLILRHLRAVGGRSRARLAAETGLSKATTSSLIADLAGRGLVTEGETVRGGAVGRPGQTVEVDGRRVCGIGVEVNVAFLALTAADLQGTVLREDVRPLDVPHLTQDQVLDEVADLVGTALTALTTGGFRTVAVGVAAPGIIDPASGDVRFAPNLGWHDVPLATGVAKRLGTGAPPILVENDPKLGVLAEYAGLAGDGVQDVLFITGDVGVGAGIVSGGSLLRGGSGLAGEVGHLALDPAGTPCACGRVGCWETMIGLTPFLQRAAPADDAVHDPAIPLGDRMATLRRRADGGSISVLRALDRIGSGLGLGLSVLVDILDPQIVVLGGYFASFGDHLVPQVSAALAARRMEHGSEPRVTASRLGLMAPSRGGAHLALEGVFEDPTLLPPLAGGTSRTQG